MTQELTFREKQILLGSLLGDGSITLSSPKSARIKFNHAESQRALVDWKYNELKRWVGTGPKSVPNGGYGETNYKFSTLSSSVFLEMFRLVRPRDKKEVNAEWLDQITDPVALAAWYMDDGSQGVSTMQIHTEGFSKEEVEMLADWVKSFWGVDCKPYQYKSYWRLNFSATGRDKFQNIIRKHVIPEFTYKLMVKLEKIYCSMCGVECEVNRNCFHGRTRFLLCGKEECSKKCNNMRSRAWIWNKTRSKTI